LQGEISSSVAFGGLRLESPKEGINVNVTGGNGSGTNRIVLVERMKEFSLEEEQSRASLGILLHLSCKRA
jgi:hypothetical protein